MQFRFLYIAIWSNCYLNRGRLKNIATKRGKDQGRFHALFAPHKVNYEPPTLWKTGENDSKRSYLYYALSSINVWWRSKK